MRSRSWLAVLFALLMYLGISNGNLAIYRSGDTKPVQVLPYDAGMFPEADQQALAEGIPFSTPAELNTLLEDFTS